MSIEVVLHQMIIIFVLILIGLFLHKKSLFNENTSRQISSLIVNFCNPALLICSVFDEGPKASGQELLTGAFLVLLAYAILLLCGYLLPHILKVPAKDHFAYRLITIYGNVSFIGIPLASAVLGPGSLIYVSLNNLVYNFLIYTHGLSVIRKAAGIEEKKTEDFLSRLKMLTKKCINIGTVSAAVTLILYLCDFGVPTLISDTLSSIGRCATFLSMLVLGVSVAQMPLRDIFTHGRLYIFTLLRMILLPIGCVFLFRLFTDNALIINTTALLLAVPVGNMPLILSKEYGINHPVISRGIILTTLLSVITIPLVTMLISA